MLQLDSSWEHPDVNVSLPGDAVHLWVAALDQPDSVLPDLEHTLSPDEIARADRFAFPHLRRQYVAARGILRDILARYLGVSAAGLQFTYGAEGKPALVDDRLHFNLSHSQDIVVYSITSPEREVGVDIEYARRSLSDLEGLVARTFSRNETAALMSLPPAQRQQAFFNCWTRKEAYIKAVGKGLSYPLGDFDVTLRPDDPARLLRVAPQPAELDRWHYEVCDLPGGYTLALIADGQWSSRRWQWWPVGFGEID